MMLNTCVGALKGVKRIDMKFLIIGLGSMGKRRIRNLQALHTGTIIGVDLRDDRRKEVEEKYNIKTIKNLQDVPIDLIDAVIVSTPPDKHDFGIQYAIDNRKPVFVEASVVLGKLEDLQALARKKHVLVCPSCTFRFHPAIQIIKKLVVSGTFGKVTNFSYHMGQYLPDWHPWEKLSDCYTSKKETGGAREMVAFELTWLTDVVGFPKRIVGFFGKTISMGVDIDDTYAFSLDCGGKYGTVTVDVVARYATRRFLLNLEYGQILWSWDDPFIRIYGAKKKKWSSRSYQKGTAAKGYNKNIAEDMYVDEMRAFINAIKGKRQFQNTLSDDINVLKLLYSVEGQ